MYRSLQGISDQIAARSRNGFLRALCPTRTKLRHSRLDELAWDCNRTLHASQPSTGSSVFAVILTGEIPSQDDFSRPRWPPIKKKK